MVRGTLLSHVTRHVNSGGDVGGVTPPPNVWNMRLQLENYSLHLEYVGSMGTHFKVNSHCGASLPKLESEQTLHLQFVDLITAPLYANLQCWAS